MRAERESLLHCIKSVSFVWWIIHSYSTLRRQVVVVYACTKIDITPFFCTNWLVSIWFTHYSVTSNKISHYYSYTSSLDVFEQSIPTYPWFEFPFIPPPPHLPSFFFVLSISWSWAVCCASPPILCVRRHVVSECACLFVPSVYKWVCMCVPWVPYHVFIWPAGIPVGWPLRCLSKDWLFV